MENQFRIKHLPDPISMREAALNFYVDNNFNNRSTIWNSAWVDFDDEKPDKVSFVKIKSLPAVHDHLTPEDYVNEALSSSVDESSLIGLDLDEKLKPGEQDSISPNSTLALPKTIIEKPTKAFVDSLSINDRLRRDM